MANVKKQAKNAKHTTESDLQEEISKFEKEWYARPYADRVRKPAKIFAISLFLTIIFYQFSPELAGLIGIVAFFSGFDAITNALGGRPLTPTEQAIQNKEYSTNPLYRGWAGNIWPK